MPNVEIMALGAYQTNCYLVWKESSGSCAVIDPGYFPEQVLSRVKELGKKVDAVLLTHGHFDHVGAVRGIAEATRCRVWMHERDYSQFKNPTNLYFYPLANCDTPEIHFCEEGEAIPAGGLTFQVMETPGHTWGSVCYRCEDALFTGDTLFEGSCGRTDLPGGSSRDLGESLERLRDLEEDFRVYPGHGSATTLSREKQFNPYLRGIL